LTLARYELAFAFWIRGAAFIYSLPSSISMLILSYFVSGYGLILFICCSAAFGSLGLVMIRT